MHAAPAPAHCPHAKFVLTSSDEGQSWSAPRNLTAELAAMPGIWAPGPATGISLPTGRLLACGSYRPFPKYSAKPPIRSISQCIASDDYGESWRKVGAANHRGVQGTATDLQPNEVQPALLANGSILLNMRNVGTAHGYRLLALSTDHGESFGAPWSEKQLYDYPSTEGSMIRHGSCLYVSNLGEAPADRRINDPCNPPPHPSPCGSRHNLTLHVSCDEATTWRLLRSIYAGPAAYSSLAAVAWDPSAIGVLFESGPPAAAAANSTTYARELAPYHQLSYAEITVGGGAQL